jgi:hypothetical protein
MECRPDLQTVSRNSYAGNIKISKSYSDPEDEIQAAGGWYHFFFRALVSDPSSKMLNRLRRNPGVSADNGLTVTEGSSAGPFME